jgi:hypothetical protein
MILNLILLGIILVSIILLIQQLKKPSVDSLILSPCNFKITEPEYEINGEKRTARYKVISKNKNRFFLDFPVEFSFLSDFKFISKIRITYIHFDDDEIELIYDRIVRSDGSNDNIKKHIYYINDVVIGGINIEICTHSRQGKPTIIFEILQNITCHMIKEHKLIIEFPE